MLINDELKEVIKELESLSEEEMNFLKKTTWPTIIKELEDILNKNKIIIVEEINRKGITINSLFDETKDFMTEIENINNELIKQLFKDIFEKLKLFLKEVYSAKVFVELCHPNAKIPKYAHNGDMGADIYAIEDAVIEPHTYGNMISTGLKFKIPFGWAISIRPRSGMSKNTTLRISNVPATIDQNYRGEVKILFDNIGDEPVLIKAGDRIAQFILEHSYTANFEEVEEISSDTNRGAGGFGSSGSN